MIFELFVKKILAGNSNQSLSKIFSSVVPGLASFKHSVFWDLESLLLLLKEKMIENLLKKTPAFIWHIKHWYLITGDRSNEQICKQRVTISVFWGLESLFVTKKGIVVNQNALRFIAEYFSFHLTYQILMSDHWWLL